MAEEASRLPALVTLLVVLSGITVAGIGAPLWGLLAGGAVMVVLSAGTRTRTAR
ncbi:benzoate/H(+) symporter BenE family transporter [Endobacter medicaginis]